MAFSRNWLKAMGLTEEQVESVMAEHVSVTDALKKERDQYKTDLATEQTATKTETDKLSKVQKELDDLKKEDWKKKYEDEHTALETLRTEATQKETQEKIRAAYKKLLQDEKINSDRIDLVMKKTDFSEMALDKDGNLENLDGLKKTISEDWGCFQVTTSNRKASVATPPGDNNGHTSRAKELQQKYYEEKYGIKPDAGKE